MIGIDLNKNITFLDASMRYFDKDECHVTRTSQCDVLVMVFDGILRFSEDGIEYEVHPGEYHIQKAGTYQEGKIPSLEPKYLYMHFWASWNDGAGVLPKRGSFNFKNMRTDMEALDRIAKGSFTKLEATVKFLGILSELYLKKKENNLANNIEEYIFNNYKSGISLDEMSNEFHFSKNHLINVFRQEFGMTPFEYLGTIRLKEAERLLSVTSRPIESIAYECGFGDYSQFYKSFFRENGMSPRKWRDMRQI